MDVNGRLPSGKRLHSELVSIQKAIADGQRHSGSSNEQMVCFEFVM